jgi:hypothetical protein
VFVPVPYLRLLVAGFSPQRPWFNPRVAYVEFVAHKFALLHVFLGTLRFSPTNYHSANGACIPSYGKKIQLRLQYEWSLCLKYRIFIGYDKLNAVPSMC